jgi:hypothetical protein
MMQRFFLALCATLLVGANAASLACNGKSFTNLQLKEYDLPPSATCESKGEMCSFLNVHFGVTKQSPFKFVEKAPPVTLSFLSRYCWH